MRYRWERNYELGDRRHWAINDTENDERGVVSCASMVLMLYRDLWFGLPFKDQPLARRIIAALNATAHMTVEQIETMEPSDGR